VTGTALRSEIAPGTILGDSPSRDYARKLLRFNAFAAPEIKGLIAGLGLAAGMRVLDAGCGCGEALGWFRAAVGRSGSVIGWDLAAAHVASARALAVPGSVVEQCDLLRAELPAPRADLVWCVNTLNHLADPVHAARRLAGWLAPAGRLAVGQSSLLPDMYFAWDARLERVVNDAVRRYYRERYGLAERDLKAVRSLVGILRAAGLAEVTAHSILIERTSPIDAATARYLADTIFTATWGERLRHYLDADDYSQLCRLCDPRDPEFALARPDFHFLQTFTLVTARPC
jgi:SAM-dependent methyltransferase